MSQPIHVDQSSVVSLAGQMDELSHRAQDVLSRYSDLVQHGNSAQYLRGSAGSTNLVTAEEIHEAQNKIQSRFQSVNELLRSGASQYHNTDSEAQGHIASVAGHLRFT
ncbi:type VII secretion target [Mycobacterium sp. 050128]|uniref:type VII secretion target n=1 Tax=unclassified Mycobacterium TaxID=2642494 RepID=UPI002EDB90E1